MEKEASFSIKNNTTCIDCGYTFATTFIYENKPNAVFCDACYVRLCKSDMPQFLTINNKTIKLDDIFVSSWGYEQTNVNFYQVVGFKGKVVLLKEINKVKVESYEKSLCGVALPLKDDFKQTKILNKKVRDYGNDLAVNISSFELAYLLKENETIEYSEYY